MEFKPSSEHLLQELRSAEQRTLPEADCMISNGKKTKMANWSWRFISRHILRS
jgi:hypothetical protein